MLEELRRIFQLKSLRISAQGTSLLEDRELVKYIENFFAKIDALPADWYEANAQIRVFTATVGSFLKLVPIRKRENVLGQFFLEGSRGEVYEHISAMLASYQKTEEFRSLTEQPPSKDSRKLFYSYSEAHSSFLKELNWASLGHLTVLMLAGIKIQERFLFEVSRSFLVSPASEAGLFEGLAQLTQLKRLDLSSNKLGAALADIGSLAVYLRENSTLIELVLKNNCLNDASFKLIFGFANQDDENQLGTLFFQPRNKLRVIDLSVNFLELSLLTRLCSDHREQFLSKLGEKQITFDVTANYTATIDKNAETMVFGSNLSGYEDFFETRPVVIESILRRALITQDSWIAVTVNYIASQHCSNWVEAMSKTGELILIQYDFGTAAVSESQTKSKLSLFRLFSEMGGYEICTPDVCSFVLARETDYEFSLWSRTKPSKIEKMHAEYVGAREQSPREFSLLGKNCFWEAKQFIGKRIDGQEIRTATNIPANHMHYKMSRYQGRVSYD